MRIEEFLSKVASEPERTLMETHWTSPPELLARMKQPGGMRLTDFLAAPGRIPEQCECRYRHILGAPASPDAIAAWQRQHPSHPLPADLQALVARINGIHLWADSETGWCYQGFAPIEKWDLARSTMYWGPTTDPSLLDDHYIALSYDEGHASYIVLNIKSGKYYLMDVAGPDESCPIADNVEELLDYLWERRMTPKASPPEE